MYRIFSGILAAGATLAAAIATVPSAAASQTRPFMALGEITRPPLGWVQFCLENSRDCGPAPSVAGSVLTTQSWQELVRINNLVNVRVKPMTDLDHFGVIEKWAYPDDGYGDCEDYVLLKRRMLEEAGWPRSALLITVVRDENGDGHAVLTVSTDRGDLILDNQAPDIKLWSDTPYRYVKRQSQGDPNVWVSLGDRRQAVPTATSR